MFHFLKLCVNFNLEPWQLLVSVYFFFIVIKQNGDARTIDRGVWLMTPNGTHQVVEPNSTVAITCDYAFEDDIIEHRYSNLTWKWELPDYLTKNSKVFSR
jgi:hypothetical protein